MLDGRQPSAELFAVMTVDIKYRSIDPQGLAARMARELLRYAVGIVLPQPLHAQGSDCGARILATVSGFVGLVASVLANLPTLFYNDCEAMDVYRAMERLRPQAVAIPTTPASFTRERWGGVKRWYVYCTRSNAITLSMQRAMVAAAPCETLSLDAGHSPFYSVPRELADALEKIAATATA